MNAEDIGELPEGWALATLDDGLALSVQPGFACGANNRDGTGVPHLRPMNVSESGLIVLDDVKYVPTEEANREERRLRKGDVLFNNTNSPALVGKTAYYDDEEPRAFSNHMTRVRTHLEGLDPRFCAMVLHQRWREQYFEKVCNNHIGQSSISRSVLGEVPIPLPPLEEQRRVVAAVEAVLAKVNTARDRLNRVPSILKRFRLAMLSAACSGRLTADWREKNPAIEPAAAQLARCATATEGARQGKRHRRGTEGLAEVEFPDDLPDSWVIQTVRELEDCGALIGFQDGNHGSLYPRAAEFGDEGVKFLTATQVFDNRVLLEQAPRLAHKKASELRIGFAQTRDVLLTHNATVGRVAILPHTTEQVILGTSVTYYRFRPDYILPEFIAYAMQGSFWQQQLESVMEQTTRNQVSITKQIEFSLPIPPLAEQQEIVRRVGELFAIAAVIEARLTDSRQMADQLTQAVLAKAFRGELVPTEAALARREKRTYEPAADLLARIRAERENATPAAGRSERKPRKRAE